MGLDSISSGYGLNFWQLQQGNADNSGASGNTASAYQGRAASAAAYSSTNDMVSSLSTAIKQAMSTLGLGKNDRVTFATLNEARAKMEDAFTSQVKADLRDLGVDEDIEFRLVTNSQGGVDVISTHPDAGMVEKYFEDNPDMVERFQEIQAMSNVEEARKASGYDIKAIRERIQVESMIDWFAGTGQGVQQLMQYEDMSAVYSAAGISKIA
jgi:hypothetical protein